MKQLNIPVGISDFAELRQRGYYYIDKSGLIREILETSAPKVTLITRPRRFGKTLGMSMLAYFFDIRKDSRLLFQNLEIAEHTSLCNEWMNQYPTIFFSMKDIDGLTFSTAFEQLQIQISNLFKSHPYLLDCDEIDPDDKDIFLQLKARQTNAVLVSRSLNLLTHMMQIYYNKPVILLLDEYDVPIAKANDHGYYAQMLELIRIMMSSVLKDNSALRFAVITGCLKIAKESIFTGINNLVSDTITGSRLSEYFGFTQHDVDQILQNTDAMEYREPIRAWYDGYHFGDSDVYCPWDVMNYLRDLQFDPSAKPVCYWKNTSSNSIVRSFIDYAGSSITKKLETLLAGGYVIQQIDEGLTYDYLHASEDNLWSILYLTGYLTRVREEELVSPLREGAFALTIPNLEIREIFESTIMKWFDESARTWDRRNLFDAFWKGDSETLTLEMNRLLRKTISYHDYREDFYHAFLAGIFTCAGYLVESNREHGEGRSDVVIYDSENGQVAIFEVKYSRTLDNMEKACEAALRQIDSRMYTKEFEEDYDHILCYGISFFKKRCLVKKKQT